MTETNKQPTTEAGRSMVEMLGVLAVIGVLSIGGIAGYNLGMEKQRANELLEASLQRAYTVSAQILSGREASLVEFNKDTSKAGGTFQEDVEEQYLGEIGIKIHAVNQNVCKALVRSITDTSPLRGIAFTGTETDVTEADCQESNDLTLYYNDDMSLTENNRDNAGGNDGLCPDGLPKCGEQCCAEGTYCTQGTDTSTYTCSKPTSGCTKNSDCNTETQYCKLTASDCAGPTGGTCTDKGTLSSTALELGKGDLTVYMSSGTMNWWSAQNLCQAHGKQLVTMADLGISDQEGKTYCYFNHSKTTDVTLQCACAGDEGCTQTAREVRALGTSSNLWLADNSKANSCRARFAPLRNGDVKDASRTSSYSALCR